MCFKIRTPLGLKHLNFRVFLFISHRKYPSDVYVFTSFLSVGVPKMGSDTSKPKGQQNSQSSSQPSRQAAGRILKDTKKVLLVHMSDTKQQELIVRHFRDALTHSACGSVKVEMTVNIANEKDDVKNSSWLDGVNNVILLCLKSEAIALLEQIVREKKYVENDRLNGKVFSVSFGGSLNSQWPPGGMQKDTDHCRDFAFNFENVDSLTPKDFERSDRMTALVAAMKGS